MADVSLKKRANKENNRIKKLLKNAGVTDKRIKILEPVVQNTAWMKAKLDDAREEIQDSQVVISYDNGGGQKGTHENPLFKGYENLWRSYMQGMSKILEALPEEVAEAEAQEAEKPKTVLELIRSKHEKEA